MEMRPTQPIDIPVPSTPPQQRIPTNRREKMCLPREGPANPAKNTSLILHTETENKPFSSIESSSQDFDDTEMKYEPFQATKPPEVKKERRRQPLSEEEPNTPVEERVATRAPSDPIPIPKRTLSSDEIDATHLSQMTTFSLFPGESTRIEVLQCSVLFRS